LRDLATALATQRAGSAATGSAPDNELPNAVDAWIDARIRLAVTRDLR
jgi:hypothetical protein